MGELWTDFRTQKPVSKKSKKPKAREGLPKSQGGQTQGGLTQW
jgi:hypothetical protein